MIGIDIENIERFKELKENHLEKVFTENELNYAKEFKDIYSHLAGMWCVKEAFIKAVKIREIPIKLIEVLHDNNGAPYLTLTSKLKKYLDKLKFSAIDISISHTSKIATAIVQII